MMRIFKDRIFNLAIMISIAWHIFWISMVNVVVTSEETNPIKFSKVSFLGPILERGVLELKIRPRERSFLEKRYLLVISKLDEGETAQHAYQTNWNIKIDGLKKKNDTKLTHFIEEALGGLKIEPRL